MTTYQVTLSTGETVSVELQDRERIEMQAVCMFGGKTFETDWFDERAYMPNHVVESLLDRLNHHAEKLAAQKQELEREQELARLERWNAGKPLQVTQ